jgi:multiple sugar transport system permease protein
MRAALVWIARYSLALALAAAFVLPMVFVAFTALMPDQQAMTSALWPSSWQWSNLWTVFDRAPVLTWLINTIVYATLATAFTLVSSVPTA